MSAKKPNRPVRFNKDTRGLLEAPMGSTLQFRVQKVIFGDYTDPTVSLTFNTRFVWEPTWSQSDVSQTPPDVNVGSVKSRAVIVNQLNTPPNPPGWWSQKSKDVLKTTGLKEFNVYWGFDNEEIVGNPTYALIVEPIPK